jgi:DeoR family transcriptional regulator, catabolite repression regulator
VRKLEANRFEMRWSIRLHLSVPKFLKEPEDLVLMNNDVAERPIIQASGVLPMRRPTEYPDLREKDPAVHGMTDFTCKVPISVAPERPIDEALADMMRFGVRSLVVVSGDSVVGLITSYDIEGTRPVRFSQRSNITRREYIRVGDIMTEWDDVPTVDWSTMQSARIADLLEIFQGVGVMHLLVVEGDDGGATVVRGLVSRARLERRLNGAGASKSGAAVVLRSS